MDRLPKEEALAIGMRGRPAKYPWAEWLQDGETIVIWEGEDYSVGTDAMRVTVNSAARRRDGAAATSVQRVEGKTGLKVTFRKVEEAPLWDSTTP
jgi:hypothetical protein